MNAELSILFLDDCRYNIEEAKSVFKRQNIYKLFTYSSCPLEALLLLKEKNYDLLILDYSMPIFNGSELIGFLNRLKKNKLPVIACSCEKKFNRRMSKFKNVIASFEKDYEKIGDYINKNTQFIKNIKVA